MEKLLSTEAKKKKVMYIECILYIYIYILNNQNLTNSNYDNMCLTARKCDMYIIKVEAKRKIYIQEIRQLYFWNLDLHYAVRNVN